MSTMTTGVLSTEVKTLYERRLLSRALPRLLHTRFAEAPIAISGMGNLEWRKFPSMSANTTALVEGVTPSPSSVSVTSVTATPLWYGSFIRHSDQLQFTAFDPVISIFSELLGEQAGLSLDTIARDDYIAGATVRYANGVAARTDIDSTNDKISYKDIVNTIGALMANNALPTQNGRYVAIIHPYTLATMLQDSTLSTLFQNADVRGDANRAISGYIGTFMMTDWYVTSNAKTYASNTTVYTALFFGKEAVGVVGISNYIGREQDMGATTEFTMTGKTVKPVDIIVKPLGSSGSEDPLEQRGTIAWKASQDTAVLNSTWLVSLEHATTFSA